MGEYFEFFYVGGLEYKNLKYNFLMFYKLNITYYTFEIKIDKKCIFCDFGFFQNTNRDFFTLLKIKDRGWAGSEGSFSI